MPQANHIWTRFVLDIPRTEREHVRPASVEAVMWFKDAAAGLSLVVFVASSYLLVPVTQAFLSSF